MWSAEQAWALVLGGAILVVLLMGAGYWIGQRGRGGKGHRLVHPTPTRSHTSPARRKVRRRSR